VVGFTREPVQSMGGVTVQPTCSLAEVDPTDVALFILPGGDRWEQQPLEPELKDLLRRLDGRGVPIAAIARAGVLRGRRHTSNGLEYLRRHAPAYTESAAYVDAPAVRDRGLITASGLADVEFAQEILAELRVLSADDRAYWARLFCNGRFQPGAA
jgi:putative intracellular protease/amidase